MRPWVKALKVGYARATTRIVFARVYARDGRTLAKVAIVFAEPYLWL